MSKILFVIKCQEDKYYLGLSNTFPAIFYRYLDNVDNIPWLNVYKPIRLVYIKHFFDKNMLNSCVIHYMYTYGIENVRGGKYSNIMLNIFEYNEISEKFDELF